VLFWLPVTGRLIQRLVLALILGCHSSYWTFANQVKPSLATTCS
jgi:hypothetical protein